MAIAIPVNAVIFKRSQGGSDCKDGLVSTWIETSPPKTTLIL